jgi:hypothetical protein
MITGNGSSLPGDPPLAVLARQLDGWEALPVAKEGVVTSE